MKYTGIELLKKLCEINAPTGREDKVAEFVREQTEGLCEYIPDRIGNLICLVKGEETENPVKIMISAHMDEVGFMVTGILENGLIKVGSVGGIDPVCLSARRVISESGVKGSIISKPIHLLTSEERGQAPKLKNLSIDVGALTKKEAEALTFVGDYFTFDSDYQEYGNGFIKCKALDDRLGCAIMCQAIKDLCSEGIKPSVDLYFAFTCREEVGYSGAFCASEQIHPDYAFIIESTAVGDAYSSDSESTVASLGNGGAISFADRGTIYDRAFTEKLISVCKDKCIDYQMKKYVSGGNDSSHIQRSGFGVKVAVMSAPSRYIHSASCVIHKNDVESIYKALYYLIADWGK